ncbi:glycosyl hydrolase family 28 protein [Actinoplanes sp. KI2]|uniref:glycosyl hydrolase family 28 protein n=1 Tax=Actinoplanes sp. KI2 TaxID=2983315 RepID=UPI0021D5C26A|nr:glycosyl hydrolase family 28 protein [Actinoplanes sp. KI2]MCU7727100.1 glycosyl hydrolase family 28 protein [Actinoplanes sp. KI2]
MSRRRRTLGLLAAVSALAIGASLVAANGAWAAGTFNIRDYGATGNGTGNDSGAIQRAVDAAAAAGGGTVRVPSGTYKSARTIHLKSNVIFQLDSGATITGASGAGYDAAESNPYDRYQDYGHSHFHDAMFYGDRLTGIGFVGSGTIDGGGHLITGNPDSGEADKILSLTRCNGLTLDGVRFRRGGHFAVLTNNCNNITSDHLRIDTASDRDGWNVISASNVTVTNADISANDDALVFKSDYALGAKLPNGHVTVTGSHLSAQCCNALMFGSETCGDFSDYTFQHITITGADKSGLGMVSMDGANISDVHYRDITMTGVHSPIMQKIGTRKRCGNSPGVGHISNITYDDITATGNSPSFSPTLWGESGGNRISGVTFTNVHITVPGGNGTMSTSVPSNNATDYNPKSIGTRPAYGWYIHNAENVTFTGSSVEFASNDGRPAVIANAGNNLRFDGFTVERGSNSPYDMGFQSVTGYCVTNAKTTTGAAVKVDSSSSTTSCGTPPTTVTVTAEAESGTVTAPMQVETDSSASGGQDVTVAAGNNSKPSAPSNGSTVVPFTVSAAGTYKLWGRVIAPTDDDDSFWVRVDNEPWTDWNDIPTGSSWHWAAVTDDTRGDAVLLPDLAAGAHTITYAYREDGARLDRVLITNDLTSTPTG